MDPWSPEGLPIQTFLVCKSSCVNNMGIAYLSDSMSTSMYIQLERPDFATCKIWWKHIAQCLNLGPHFASSKTLISIRVLTFACTNVHWNLYIVFIAIHYVLHRILPYCYISDLPWTTLRPKPLPEDTHATFLIMFHILSDKPQTRTLPGLPRAMAYAKSPLFTFYHMTHSPYLCFLLSHYHWLSTRPSTLPIWYICQESNPQHSPWWSYQSNNHYWYLSSLWTSPWSKG